MNAKENFVLVTDAVPDVILEVRYFSTYNFVGERIDGYEEPVVLLTREAAQALRAVSDAARAEGLRLKIYDGYRPQRAVEHFVRWAADPQADAMKQAFYPGMEKRRLFESGYISARSSHSRGSTVDLTLVDEKTGLELDMGSPFDFFGEISHPGCTEGLAAEQIANRMRLQRLMTAHGFAPLATEWWHFTLQKEPFPDGCFDFPVSAKAAQTLV